MLICTRGTGKTYPEVLFPNEFTQEHPTDDQFGDVYPSSFPIEIPTDRLIHITHNAEARRIRREFKFTAHQKFGKELGAYDGRPCGESFKFNLEKEKYDPIFPGVAVFPGFYSWWGIYPQQDYEEITTTFKEEGISVYLSDYLKTPPESRYGNRAFSCKFSDLLSAYAESRGRSTHRICIRKGGTLRYTKEICYVLIICIDSCDDREALSAFDPLELESKLFKTNGLIDHSGKIIDATGIPTFSPEHIITWANGESYSYETVAFAFYFPQPARSIRVDPECCFESRVEHKEDFCIKKQPDDGEMKCPNDI